MARQSIRLNGRQKYTFKWKEKCVRLNGKTKVFV